MEGDEVYTLGFPLGLTGDDRNYVIVPPMWGRRWALPASSKETEGVHAVWGAYRRLDLAERRRKGLAVISRFSSNPGYYGTLLRG